VPFGLTAEFPSNATEGVPYRVRFPDTLYPRANAAAQLREGTDSEKP
jgi:hypothetical protein